MERPIIFSTERVKAILDGRKTMTRRPLKDTKLYFAKDIIHRYQLPLLKDCPYGQVGERLWVRETVYENMLGEWRYKADNLEMKEGDFNKYEYFDDEDMSPRPSIFMPRWASRLTLEITEVRVEKQLDITLEDAIKEGFGEIREFNETFLRLNPHLKEANPWVWVIKFDNIGGRVK